MADSRLFTRQVSRRRVLAAAVSTTLGAAFLAACGDDDDDESASGSETRTMYVAVRTYDNVPDIEAAGAQVAETFVPEVTGIEGFIAYYFLGADDGTMVSVTVCEDKAGADESVTIARAWVEEHPDLLPPVTRVVEGSVLASA